MSFVSVVATEGFVTIMSDGRVKKVGSGEIIQEDYQKFIRVQNDKAFIAFAGIKELCEAIAINIKKTIEEGMSFDKIQKILKLTITQIIPSELTVMFAFGGLNHSNEIEFYSYNSKYKKELHFKPVDDQIAYAFLNNSSASEDEFNNKFINILRETGFSSPSSTIQAQKLLNEFVVTKDNTVNNKTFRMSIKKEK